MKVYITCKWYEGDYAHLGTLSIFQSGSKGTTHVSYDNHNVLKDKSIQVTPLMKVNDIWEWHSFCFLKLKENTFAVQR